MVGSDGIYVPGDQLAHPRAFGTFPRYLGYYIRERGILSREEGIHRITGMPATRYGLKGKGFIREGYDADFIILKCDEVYHYPEHSIINNLVSSGDSVVGLAVLNHAKILRGDFSDTKDLIEKIENVTLEDLVSMAKKVTPKTIYFLKGAER